MDFTIRTALVVGMKLLCGTPKQTHIPLTLMMFVYPAKHPSKRSYRGENKGKLSGNPKGKNPEDVWEIPNVKGNTLRRQTTMPISGWADREIGSCVDE